MECLRKVLITKKENVLRTFRNNKPDDLTAIRTNLYVAANSYTNSRDVTRTN